MSKKKFKYNPFKMWGSWIGAVILGLYLMIMRSAVGNLFEGIVPNFLKNIMIKFPSRGSCGCYEFLDCSCQYDNVGIVVWAVIGIIIGFLIGWGINALWRKLRKKR